MIPHDFVASLGVGLIGGVTSGLLGVSPGGALVIFSILLLGAEQHVAQGISLVAQIPPTSVAAIRRYWQNGSRCPTGWLVPLTLGFLAGGVGGALAAGSVSASVLRWAYVVYLSALDALMILRPPPQRLEEARGRQDAHIHWAALLAVGALGGFASGFMGIGGGLAIAAGLSAGLKAPQRQAQLISLVLAIIPTTIPAATVYWRQGSSAPWPVIAGVILGLCAGTDLGARVANRISDIGLRRLAVGFVAAMAITMAYQAIG